jgi:YidC/Oxa1 family membrane protein insertase
MTSLFHTILSRPLLNILVFFYNTIAFHDLGVAIILLTLFIRLLLFPFFHKSTRQQRIMQKIQPRIKEIQKLHKEDKVKQTEALMALYAEHGANPFSSILFLIIQLPILIALYRLFLHGLRPEALGELYSFIARPLQISETFLGLINLNGKSILLVVLAAIVQYFQGKIMLPKREPGAPQDPQEAIGRNMVLVGPILTLVILWKLPAAVGLYWVTTSVISIIQQIIVDKSYDGRLGTIHKGPGEPDGISGRQS